MIASVTNFGFWIACTCAALLVAGAIGGAVWGHLNNKESNRDR